MTQILNKSEGKDYVITAKVSAIQYKDSMADGYVSASVGEQGRAYVTTSRGRAYVTGTGDRPWIVTWPGNFTEIISDARFQELIKKPTKKKPVAKKEEE